MQAFKHLYKTSPQPAWSTAFCLVSLFLVGCPWLFFCFLRSSGSWGLFLRQWLDGRIFLLYCKHVFFCISWSGWIILLFLIAISDSLCETVYTIYHQLQRSGGWWNGVFSFASDLFILKYQGLPNVFRVLVGLTSPGRYLEDSALISSQTDFMVPSHAQIIQKTWQQRSNDYPRILE